MSFYVCRSYSSTSKAFCLPSEKDLSNLCSICLFVSKFVLLPQWFAIEGEAHAVVLALLVVVNHVLEASVLHEGHPLHRLARLLQRLAALHHAPLPVLHAVLPQGLHVQPLLVGVEVLVRLVCHIFVTSHYILVMLYYPLIEILDNKPIKVIQPIYRCYKFVKSDFFEFANYICYFYTVIF